ncbi:DsbA family protein [Kangiella sp.]|uniref:DsbA family protein n=1 Tax=Kangiella sp. TaxID=1920245 RepID=UPI0019968787|nr:DsbA family protein [Kangiella sp.]MBD3653175.1 DsbA family protein [Kangiella sp.]
MKYLLSVFALSIASAASIPGAAAIEQGQDYWRIELPDSKQLNTEDNLYFSWLGCSSCRALERELSAELEELEYVPLIARPEWRAAAKLHYTMQLLELSEQQKADMIAKIDSGDIDVTDFNAMQEELLVMGVDEEVLTELLENKELYQQVQRAERLAAKYQIQYAPTVVIKGQFATDANHTMKVDRFAEVLRYLKSL